MAARIRKGDTVVVISGVNKGRRGEVAVVMPKEERAIVSGRQHGDASRQADRMGDQGGIQRREAAIHLSNLMLIDPKTDQSDQGRFPGAGQRHQGPCRPQDRRSDRELRP